jgi:hypothetical protein
MVPTETLLVFAAAVVLKSIRFGTSWLGNGGANELALKRSKLSIAAAMASARDVVVGSTGGFLKPTMP